MSSIIAPHLQIKYLSRSRKTHLTSPSRPRRSHIGPLLTPVISQDLIRNCAPRNQHHPTYSPLSNYTYILSVTPRLKHGSHPTHLTIPRKLDSLAFTTNLQVGIVGDFTSQKSQVSAMKQEIRLNQLLQSPCKLGQSVILQAERVRFLLCSMRLDSCSFYNHP
eukprot:g76186.t1